MFITFEMIIIFLGIISVPIIFMLNKPKDKQKIKIVENDIVLFDDDLKELIQETFKDSVSYDYDEIELINDVIIQDLKDNIKERIQHDYGKIELVSESTINEIAENINSSIRTDADYSAMTELNTRLKETLEDSIEIMINSYIEAFHKEQKLNHNKLNTKTIYEIIPDKYIDLLENDIENCIISFGNIVYMGNLKINVFLHNPNEFWYIEIIKDKSIKYGLSLNQKKRIQNILAYIKFVSGSKLNINEMDSSNSLSSFNYIKKRIQNGN